MRVRILLGAPKLTKTNRIISVRFFISWFATGLVTMQCIVCTLRVPLHAADAPLGNNIALLALLRSFYSLQVLLSAPSVMVYKKRLIDHHACVRSPKSQNLFLSKRFINSYFGFFNTEQVFYFRCYYLYKILTTLIKNYFVFLFFRIVPNPTTW